MVGKINSHTNKLKAIFFSLAILFLPATLYAFEAIKNVPSRNTCFTGREAYLNNMQKMLSQYSKVYLTGYGGIGKSQLAKEYYYIHSQEYDLVWWFDLRGDLEIQYENLLTHLSNNKDFKKLLHININDIAPSVLVDFTNSLLSQCKCRWLLIFDNVIKNQDIKTPRTKTKAARQHIIITTREKKVFGDNILTLGSFTNQESEQFLFKVHPGEKKEEIIKLSKALSNYPLALAQISEEILLYKKGIDQYLKKRYLLSMKTPTMHSEVTQEYSNNYHEVLNLTLSEIEQKDKEVAKLLYMVALLSVDLKKEFITDLFGEEVEEKLVTLTKHGVIQTTNYEHSQVLTIHDIIKEEALKRLNSKPKDYQIEIFQDLEKHFKEFYAGKTIQQLYELDTTNNHIAAAYAFLNLSLQNDTIDEGTVNIATVAIRLNNMLYNRRANYAFLYQELLSKIYNKNLKNVPPDKKALLYASIIPYLVTIESEERISKIKKELLQLVDVLEKEKDYETLFYVYIRISTYHMAAGDFGETKKYLEAAQKYINYADSHFSLILFWYCNAWLFCELRDVNSGTNALDNFLKLSNELLSPLGRLFARDIKTKFLIIKGQNELAQKELDETMQEAMVYSNNTPTMILGQLEYTKTMLYFQSRNHSQSKAQCYHALKIMTKIMGIDLRDQPQAHVHAMLGKIYEDNNKHDEALEEYMKALKYYSNRSRGGVNNFYAYGELLSNLSLFYYKQCNYVEAKHCFQALISNFGLEHDIVEKLIKKLPPGFMYQIGGSSEK